MSIENLMWQEGWTPTSDSEVTQLMKHLSTKSKEVTRVVQSAKEEIAQLEAIGKEAEDSLSKVESRVKYLLNQYIKNEVDEDDLHETATQIKYKLARGEIVLKKAGKTLGKPTAEDEVLLSATYPEFVKSEPKFQWGDFKKSISINDDGKAVHKDTGDEVYVPVLETPEEIAVKLKL